MSKNLVLIDASSFIYRAYFAMDKHKLTRKDGTSSGAIYGVRNMMLGILATKPDYVAFVLDVKGKNFRYDIYPEYKSTRSPTPDDLVAQIKSIHAMVEAMGISVFGAKGFEADDVIGTLAIQAQEKGYDVSIATGDKDFSQLLKPGIRIVDTLKGIVVTHKDIKKKYGVKPSAFIDYLALVGDTADAIPGVRGCGPATATKLLTEHKSLKGILASDSTNTKVKLVQAHKKIARICRKLATIHTAVPELPTIKSLKRKEMNTALFHKIQAEWNIHKGVKLKESNKPKKVVRKPTTSLFKK